MFYFNSIYFFFGFRVDEQAQLTNPDNPFKSSLVCNIDIDFSFSGVSYKPIFFCTPNFS